MTPQQKQKQVWGSKNKIISSFFFQTTHFYSDQTQEPVWESRLFFKLRYMTTKYDCLKGQSAVFAEEIQLGILIFTI